MPVAFTGKYWQIMENTGKYDLQPSTFRLFIIGYFISTNLSGYQLNYLSLKFKSNSVNIIKIELVKFRRKKTCFVQPKYSSVGLCIVTDKVGLVTLICTINQLKTPLFVVNWTLFVLS